MQWILSIASSVAWRMYTVCNELAPLPTWGIEKRIGSHVELTVIQHDHWNCFIGKRVYVGLWINRVV